MLENYEIAQRNISKITCIRWKEDTYVGISMGMLHKTRENVSEDNVKREQRRAIFARENP